MWNLENTFDLFSVHMTSYFLPRNRSVSHSISRSPKIFSHTHLGADRVFALGIGVLFRERFICWHSVTRRYHTWAVLDDFNASFTYENRQSPDIKLLQPILVHEMTSTRVWIGCNLWTGSFSVTGLSGAELLGESGLGKKIDQFLAIINLIHW